MRFFTLLFCLANVVQCTDKTNLKSISGTDSVTVMNESLPFDNEVTESDTLLFLQNFNKMADSSNSSSDENIMYDHRLIKLFTLETLEILSTSDSTYFQLIYPFKKKASHDSISYRIAGYPIKSKKVVLTPERQLEFNKLLLDPNTFILNDEVKTCLFTPGYAVVYSKGLIVLICLNCDVVKFISNNNEFIEDIDPSSKKFKDFFNSFPIK